MHFKDLGNKKGWIKDKRSQQLAKWIWDNLIDNLNILDIGSGSGLFYLQLNRIGFEKTTKNIIEPQIKNHEWYKKNNINIIEESIFHINEKHNNSFDLIFLSHSLEHFDSISVNTLIANIYKCEIDYPEDNDKLQNIKNEPNNYFQKFWKPKISLLEGIKKCI